LTNIKFCGSLYIARLEVIEMKSYTVKEIAETLKTDPETVRRWIRSGKLDSTITSTKSGHIITEDALNKFIKDDVSFKIKGNVLNIALDSYHPFDSTKFNDPDKIKIYIPIQFIDKTGTKYISFKKNDNGISK
jgi:excisionase family DNA binding protein